MANVTNIGALTTLTTSAAALANLVLVTPSATKGYQPKNPPTSLGFPSTAPLPPTFVFQYEGEQKIICESDITDHYTEDNVAIQDNIALKPEKYTTRGFIGELNNVVPEYLRILEQTALSLTLLDSYTPQLSPTALIGYTKALLAYEQASQAANSAVSAWTTLQNVFQGGSSQNVVGSGVITKGNQLNKQQTAFAELYGYWAQRTLFDVQTPWAVLTNMAIENMTSTQTEETNKISEFEVTFKSIRVAKTKTEAGNLSSIMSGRSASQAAGMQNNGTTTPQAAGSLGSKVGF